MVVVYVWTDYIVWRNKGVEVVALVNLDFYSCHSKVA